MSFSDFQAVAASPRWWTPIQKTQGAGGSRTRGSFLFTQAPNAGSFSGSAGVATALSANSTGAPNIGADQSPATRHLLAVELVSSIRAGRQEVDPFLLLDLLLYYPACVVTGTPTALDNTVTLPRYTDGAGVMALAKQARPQLDTRFAKHLLARTCDIVDATDSTPESDGGWRTNAAGFHFNQRYGFGLIDADELTQLATLYDSPTTLLTQTTGTVAVNQTLADTGSKTVQFTLSTAQPLEEVLVTIDFETTNAYPLEVNLTAPSGYRTRLARGRDLFPSEPHARMAWQYTANALWGENPAGTWTLKIEDTKADGKQVTWHSYKVTARMGTLGLNNCISAPTNVAATDGTQEYTRVTWSAVSGATHYCVYRATSDDFGLAVAIGNWQTGTSYDDTTCLPLTAYYYWVRAASDSIGQCGSLPSNSDMGWSKLRPPTGVSASDGTTTDGVQITWDSAPMATYYRVYRNDVNNPAFAIPISSWQTELSYLDVSTAAVPGVDKYYWVCSAVNSSGGAESWFSAVDTGYRKLSSPAGVQATQGTYSNYVRVTWSAVWGASYYRVYRSSTNDPATAVGIGAWSISTSYNDTTAEPCDSHYYWVRAAVNSGGARPSDVSTAASGYRPMPAPTNVSASDGTYTAYCQVTWDAVSGATHYRVWRSTTNDPATAQQLSSWQMGTSYNHTGQYGQTNYYWITAAKDSSGLCASEKSASDSGWRGLLPPNCVNATDGQYMDRVWIGWCWGQYDIYHKIYRGLTSDPAAATAITGWIDTSFYEDTTGDLGVEYYYFVKAALAADGTGESDYSLGDLGWREIPAPANVAASDGSSTSYVRVTWDSGGAGLWYQVYRGTSSDPKFSTNISAWLDGVTSFDDTTAEAGTTYYYWVAAAADGAGTGASDAGGPDTGWRAIAGPDATASDGTYTNRVAVSWFIAPGSPYYFRVYRASVNNSAQALPLSAWRTGSSYSDTSADPGVYYYYWVKAAMDAAGTNAGPFGRGNRGHRALDCNNNGVPDQNDPDADGDGVPDDCDLCPNTLAGALVDATGCPLPIPGDYDHDGDVDEDDYGTFLMCSFGPAVPRTAGCVDMDFDHDYDVDVNDFGVFQRCYSGRNIAGNPNCAD